MARSLSRFGVLCRKLRIERQELLGEMAGRFDVSAAFLSKVENGKAKPPANWKTILTKEYNLTANEINELDEALFEANNQKSIDISGYSDEDRNLMWAFARKLDKLDRTKLKKILDEKE